MLRSLHLLASIGVGLGLTLAGWGCGGSRPTDEEIWHTPTLRPGQIPPDGPGERELLSRLTDLKGGKPVTFQGQLFVADPPYPAASGRICRRVRIRPAQGEGDAREKLACEDWGSWVFVPDPFAAATAEGPTLRSDP